MTVVEVVAVASSVTAIGLGILNWLGNRKDSSKQQRQFDVNAQSTELGQALTGLKTLNDGLTSRNNGLKTELHDAKREHDVIEAKYEALVRRDYVRQRREDILVKIIEDQLGITLPDLPALPDI